MREYLRVLALGVSGRADAPYIAGGSTKVHRYVCITTV